MLKYLFTSLIFIGSFLFSYGQEYNEVVKQDIFGNPENAQNQMYINMMNHGNRLDDAGETALFPDWQAMEVEGINEVSLSLDSANYNYATDQFYFIHDGKMYYLASDKVKNINIGTADFSTYPYENGKEIKNGFFQVLVDGDFPLLKRTYLKKVVTNDHPMKLPQANEFIFEKTSDLYYFNEKNKVLEKLPRSKKKFINLFRRRQAKLIRFAEEQKISTNDEDDVIRFFQYNKAINTEQNQ